MVPRPRFPPLQPGIDLRAVSCWAHAQRNSPPARIAARSVVARAKGSVGLRHRYRIDVQHAHQICSNVCSNPYSGRMSARSAIEWTEATWNPTTGCDRISAGCDNCYALDLAKRLRAMGVAKYQTDGDPRTSGPGFGVAIHPEALTVPYTWKRPRLVFVNSMSDLFHARVPVAFVQEVFSVMRDTPKHTYQILTKRARRLARMAPRLDWPTNVWMGVSVESADHCDRVRDLATVPAAVRFLSCEPLLGPLSNLPLDGIDWVIAGGESGANARPVDPDWIRDLRDVCVKARTPFFFKQWGGIRPKSGGRELDGRYWDEMPSQSHLRAV
jgi:protein gp37